MSELTKLIQGHTGGSESLNNILKEALLLDRKCQNLELALKMACDCPTPNDYDPEYWLDQAVERINNEQNTTKQNVLNVLSKTCYCAAIPEPHDPLRCGAL
jgi:hypothetical protein